MDDIFLAMDKYALLSALQAQHQDTRGLYAKTLPCLSVQAITFRPSSFTTDGLLSCTYPCILMSASAPLPIPCVNETRTSTDLMSATNPRGQKQQRRVNRERPK